MRPLISVRPFYTFQVLGVSMLICLLFTSFCGKGLGVGSLQFSDLGNSVWLGSVDANFPQVTAGDESELTVVDEIEFNSEEDFLFSEINPLSSSVRILFVSKLALDLNSVPSYRIIWKRLGRAPPVKRYTLV